MNAQESRRGKPANLVRLEKAIEEVDRFNSEDPRQDTVDGVGYARELIYSERLTHWVLKLDPHASDALRIVARGQHIGRWTIPRDEYPMGRSGYLRWRNALKSFHAKKMGDILREVGYEADFIERARALMLKRDIKEDADTQTLEDALCLVFFERQFMELMNKTPADKMKNLVRKTWKKMSQKGRNAALQMKLPLQERRFIEETLAATIYGEELAALLDQTRPLRDGVTTHEIYSSIATLPQLRTFMEHHVFLVWDFMSLVKSLQKSLTCTSLPWVPQGDPLSRRLINEIILDEESDETGEGDYLSHFEIYLQGMEQCGADTSRAQDLIERIRRGEKLSDALAGADVPQPAKAFVEQTFSIVETNSPHRIAAACTLGREDVIPEMFENILKNIEGHFPAELTRFSYYLERHIHEDANRHAPMAMRMLVALCADDQDKWREAAEAAEIALRARREFLDAVNQKLHIENPC